MARRKNTTGIPQHEIDSLARAFIPAIMNYFNSEEGMREFEEWKAQRAEKQLNTEKWKRRPIDFHGMTALTV